MVEELPKWQIFLIVFGLGIFVGAIFIYEVNIKTTNEQIKVVEDILYDMPSLYPVIINNDTRIIDLIYYYDLYKFQARGLLRSQIESVCGVKEWNYQTISNQPSQRLHTFCSDICTNSSKANP